METSSCPLCGRRRTPSDVHDLVWSSHHEPGGTVTWTCPACTRAQMWQIETGLPLEPVDVALTAAPHAA